MTNRNGTGRTAISFLTLLVAALILAAPAGAQEKEKGAPQSSAADVWRQALPPEPETSEPAEGAEASAPAEPSNSREETEAGFIELERRWMEALRLRDASALTQLISDDFTLFSPRLSIAPGEREKYFNHAMRDLNLASYEFEGLTVRLYGAAALVTGRLKQTATVAGQDWGGTYLVTDVWVDRDGLWQVVSRHASLLPARQ